MTVIVLTRAVLPLFIYKCNNFAMKRIGTNLLFFIVAASNFVVIAISFSSSLQCWRNVKISNFEIFKPSKFRIFIFLKSKFQILEIPNTQCFQMFQSSFFKTWEYQIMIAAFLKLLETTNKPQIIFFVIFFKKIMKGILVASAQLCRAILTS